MDISKGQEGDSCLSHRHWGGGGGGANSPFRENIISRSPTLS